VQCFWTQLTPLGDERAARVVPDGCIDIVWIGEDEPHVAGPATHSIFPRIPGGTPIAGTRFRPGMAPCLLGVPARELRDDAVELRDVWPADLLWFTGQDASYESAGSRRDALEAALMIRLAEAQPADLVVQRAVARLVSDPSARVREVSERLELGERQLLRRFDAAVGYGPKMLGRIMRMRAALESIRGASDSRIDFAGVAYATGYADQAHMTRELVELTGAPPSRLASGSN
jgi:AraC-like DNA-binding protein